MKERKHSETDGGKERNVSENNEIKEEAKWQVGRNMERNPGSDGVSQVLVIKLLDL